MTFRLAEPWWLLLGLAPLVVWILWSRQQSTRAMSSFLLLEGVRLATWRTKLTYLPAILRVLVLAAFVVALSRPQWGETTGEPIGPGASWVLIVDVSGSMDIRDEDEGPTRWQRQLAFVEQLIESDAFARADQVGVVTLSETPRVVCPLTVDHRAAGMIVSRLEIDRLADRTNIGDAIAFAVSLLKDAPSRERHVLLISDGIHNVQEGLSPWTAARAAEAFGVTIDVVSLVRVDRAEDVESARQGIASLAKIAEITKGSLYEEEESSISELAEAIAAAARTSQRVTQRFVWRDLYAQFLVAGLALAAVEMFVRYVVLRMGSPLKGAGER